MLDRSIMIDKWRDAKMLLDTFTVEISNRDIAFSIHYWGVTPKHRDNPVHRHSFFEFCYVLDGEGSYVEGQLEYPLRAGTLFCSRPGVLHQIRSKTGMFLIYVAFEIIGEKSNPTALRKYEALKLTERIVIADCQHFPSVLLWRVLLEMADSTQTVCEAITSTIHALLVSFLLAFNDETCEESRLQPKPNEQLIKQATLFIRNNLSVPLKLSDLAGFLHLSGRHLSRLFSHTLGLPFSEYVRIERLRQAEDMLSNTNLPLKEIAQQTGFQSIHYFTRVFRAYNGIPPGKYREAEVKKAEGANGIINKDSKSYEK